MSNKLAFLTILNRKNSSQRTATPYLHRFIFILTSGLVVALALVFIPSGTQQKAHAATDSCTVSALLVNSCRPWLGAAAGFYPEGGGNYDVETQTAYQEQRIGRQYDIIHTYHTPGQGLNASDDFYIDRANTIVYANWKPVSPLNANDPTSTTDGWANIANNNASIDAMISSVKAVSPHKLFITIHHEPENDVTTDPNCPSTHFKGSYGTAADYVNMWKYIENRFAAQGVTNVLWVQDFENYPPWDCVIPDLYPGNSYVDWIFYNNYEGSSTDTWDGNMNHFINLLTADNTSARNYLSKPWGVVEWSNGNGTTAEETAYANEAKQAIDANTYPQIKAFMTWDSSTTNNDGTTNNFRTAYDNSNNYSATKDAAYIAYAQDPRFTDAYYQNSTSPDTCTTPSTDNGTDTLSVDVPTTGTYDLWLREKTANTTASTINATIDNGNCYPVGGSSLAASTWTWVNYEGGTTTQHMEQSLTAGTHTIKLVGVTAGLSVDRVLLLPPDDTCLPPTGTGDNCNKPETVTAPYYEATGLSSNYTDTNGQVWNADAFYTNGSTTGYNTTTNTIKNVPAGQSNIYQNDHYGATSYKIPIANGTYTVKLDFAELSASAGPSRTFDTSIEGNQVLSNFSVYNEVGLDAADSKSYNVTVTGGVLDIEFTDEGGRSILSGIEITPPAPPSCTTQGTLTTPTHLTATSGASYTSTTLGWSSSVASAGCTVTGYHIIRDGVSIANVTDGTNTYTDTTLSASSSYDYAVQAYDSSIIQSSVSSSTTATTKADDLAPTVPAGFSATASGSAAVTLSWTVSTDLPNPGGVGVAGYYIYRNNATTPTYTINSATKTTYQDTNVSAGTKYSYMISAFDNQANESAPSSSVSATTAAPTCSGTPSVPTGLAEVSSTLNAISFNWAASTPSAGCTIAGYHVYRNAVLQSTTATTNSYSDTGLVTNTAYVYTVAAYDTSGHTSAQSAGLSASTLADTILPIAPSSLNATASSSSQVNLSWPAGSDNVGVVSYRIYRGGTIIKTLAAPALSYVDNTVSSGTTYTYSIDDVDAAGNVSSTKTVSQAVTTPTSVDTTPPTAPTHLLAAVVTANSVSLSWTAATDNVGISHYQVLINGVLDKTPTGTSYVSQCLSPNVPYTFTVIAQDGAGNVSAAATVIATTLNSNLAGDLNCSGTVDFTDYTIMVSQGNWGQKDLPPTRGDVTGDTEDNFTDYSILLSNWGHHS